MPLVLPPESPSRIPPPPRGPAGAIPTAVKRPPLCLRVGWGGQVLGLLAFWLGVCLCPAAVLGAQNPSAREILDHIDDLFRGNSSHGTFTMQVSTAHYTRSMTLEAWSRGKDFSLIRILAPQKERGTATLRAKDNIWNYLPKIRRVIKIPSSLMGAAWMGSHFTNDDLVKESRMADDYTSEITFRGPRDGTRVIELTLTPREDAAVVWGKVVACIKADDWIPLNIVYYDEDLDEVRTMVFADVRPLGGRRLPSRLRMTPADKPGEYTEIVYDGLVFDLELPDDLFTLRSLQQ